jgi:rhamnose utilization protein RhaD (predicted bifunctional aldolase and dehydrogenase)
MNYKFVNYLWDDTTASSLDPVDRLVYRSNLLGSDQRITNTGGGNTSSKILERDPLTGENIEVLWVKVSGGDLRTSKRENFSSLYQGKLLGLQKLLCEPHRPGREVASRGRHGGHVFSCHVQSQSAREFHRHAPAQFPARATR